MSRNRDVASMSTSKMGCSVEKNVRIVLTPFRHSHHFFKIIIFTTHYACRYPTYSRWILVPALWVLICGFTFTSLNRFSVVTRWFTVLLKFHNMYKITTNNPFRLRFIKNIPMIGRILQKHVTWIQGEKNRVLLLTRHAFTLSDVNARRMTRTISWGRLYRT